MLHKESVKARFWNHSQKVNFLASLIPHEGITLAQLQKELKKHGVEMTKRELGMFLYYYLLYKHVGRVKTKDRWVYFRL